MSSTISDSLLGERDVTQAVVDMSPVHESTVVVVGACAIDTILTVPYYPEIDSKLRATSLKRRRGGNGPNTLEVLDELLQSRHIRRQEVDDHYTRLKLVAVLPNKETLHIPFIHSSFQTDTDAAVIEKSLIARSKHNHDRIDLSHCLYREAYTEPVSSYIIADEATGSRTIVNHNELPEMSLDEFKTIADEIVTSASHSIKGQISTKTLWFHFEGRIPDIVLGCIQYLRDHSFLSSQRQTATELKISVEIEKPKRPGLKELALYADVVFYSKSWALGEGFTDAHETLLEQARLLSKAKNKSCPTKRVLTCTWGAHGAWALQLPCAAEEMSDAVVFSPAYTDSTKVLVDTVGAGDTFNAGMLYALLCHDNAETLGRGRWKLQHKLAFANFLAGKKVLQYGFTELAQQVADQLLE